MTKSWRERSRAGLRRSHPATDEDTGRSDVNSTRFSATPLAWKVNGDELKKGWPHWPRRSSRRIPPSFVGRAPLVDVYSSMCKVRAVRKPSRLVLVLESWLGFGPLIGRGFINRKMYIARSIRPEDVARRPFMVMCRSFAKQRIFGFYLFICLGPPKSECAPG